MKILLVSPCLKSEIRPEAMSIPQLTLSLIAAMTPPEHEVVICEEQYGEEINFEGDYDLIGISLMTTTCLRGYEIANEFKKREKIVVFGGIHASVLPHEALLYGDAVVIGETEGGLWKQVLDDAQKNQLRPTYRLDSVPDLSCHIAPRRDLIKCRSGAFDIAPIETTRGCPYNCDFCTVTQFFGKKQRHKNIRDIVMDAESCPQRVLFFIDDNVALNRKFALELFRELIPLKKIWVGQASINIAKDPELMKVAYQSGCRALLIGFESITDEGLGTFRKTLKTVQDNIDAVKRLRDHGIFTMASLIFGLDSDTEKVFDISHEFLSKSKSAFFQSCAMTPYPGTVVFNQLKKENRILTDDWSKFDTKKVLIKPQNLTSEQLLKGYDDIRKSIYGVNSIMSRSFPYMLKGIPELFFYYSLNWGARKRYKQSIGEQIYRNPSGVPIDFDTSKYVKPYKQKVYVS